MEFRDYYTTLGVARTASDKEVRAAYRKLARELHPDVNKDPKATERFKRVNEAYEVLKDPQKRAKYDRLGADWEQVERAQPRRPSSPPFSGTPRGGARFGGFSDFFETFFGPRGQETGPDPLVELELERLRREQTAARRGQDSEHRVDVSLREAATGSDRTMQLSIEEECGTCHGTGHVSGATGDGAAAQVEVRTCPACQGSGRQTRRRSLKVSIPRGVTQGSRVRVGGEGRPGINGGPRGDLYLRVHLELEPGTEVKGRDVYSDLAVRDYRAALGGRVATRDPAGGGLEVTIPAATTSGRLLRVPGKGLPALQSGAGGDLYLRVRVTPSTRSPLPDRELRAYQELERADTGSS